MTNELVFRELTDTMRELADREFNCGLQLIYDRAVTVWLGDSLAAAHAFQTFRWEDAALAATWLSEQADAWRP